MDDKKQQKPSLIGTEEILKKQNTPNDMENHLYLIILYADLIKYYNGTVNVPNKFIATYVIVPNLKNRQNRNTKGQEVLLHFCLIQYASTLIC